MRRRDLIAAAAAGAILRPRTGWTQQPAMPMIGFLHGSAPVAQYHAYIAAFVAGLQEEGFDPGRNVAVEYRWAEGEYERIPVLAAELLALRPALMIVYGPPNVLRAGIDAVPRTIPVVFGTGGDPVASGIVPSLARPGGNVTGIANRTNTLDVKRLELLRDLVPAVVTIGMIFNPRNSDAPAITQAAEEGARTLGRRLILAGASTAEELDRAFGAVAQQGAGAVLRASDTFLEAQRDRVIGLALRYRLPTIYPTRENVAAGGLISYGANFVDMYRLVGTHAGKVLHGAKPSDLPVVEPARFELVVNLNTAKSLGLAVPQTILARANEVIE